LNSQDTHGASYIGKPQVALTLLLLLGLAAALYVLIDRPALQPQSNIRVRNASEWPLTEVNVNGVPFGDIAPGQTTSYVPVRPAYRYANVSLAAGGHSMRLQIEDYFGEKPLGKGNFTYVLTVHDIQSDSGLDIRAEMD
jgi:hypothetical protein